MFVPATRQHADQGFCSKVLVTGQEPSTVANNVANHAAECHGNASHQVLLNYAVAAADVTSPTIAHASSARASHTFAQSVSDYSWGPQADFLQDRSATDRDHHECSACHD